MLGSWRARMKRGTSLRARMGLTAFAVVIIGIAVACFLAQQPEAQAQLPPPSRDAFPEVHLRIAWGGGEPQLWRGQISVSKGQVVKQRLLGIEADEPRAIWQSGPSVRIEQPRARTYDGVDVAVVAPLDATLQIELAPLGADANAAAPVRIPIREMLANYYNGELDKQGNRLLVRRESGDMLRLHVNHPNLIFEPGEILRAQLQAFLLPVGAGGNIQLRTSLTRARDDSELWSKRQSVTLDPAGTAGSVPLEFDLPEEEGAYDLHIEALESNLGARIGLKQTIAKRKLQFLVFDSRRRFQNAAQSPAAWNEVLAVDLTSADFWSSLARWPLSGSATQPESSGHKKVVSLPTISGQAPFVSLAPSAEASIAWESIPLKGAEPGMPHIVEVEFPVDAPQNLGISIMEPNAAGRLVPIGLDSGVYRPASSLLPSIGEVGVHRLIFWPKTEQPLLLITNQSETQTCYFGKIRLLAGPAHLPSAFLVGTSALEAKRDWLGYFEKPLLAENFGATEFVDEWSGRSLDDWVTFHQASTRLSELLLHRGQTGAIVTVAADGSALFPSESILPTPRFDTGAFYDSSQDPASKDVLELLLREFDRRELKLIPAIDFATALPSLEQLARNGNPDTASMFWIGGNGRWLPARYPPNRGRAPYYNILDPRVQDAMLRVLQEVTQRASRHPSFSGIGIRLGVDGFAQLPGPEWGLDDLTVARFERQTGIQLDMANAPDRFARRRELLLGPHLQAWLEWRADQLFEFYDRAAKQLQQARPGTRLLLLGTGMLASADARQRFHPLGQEQGAVTRSLLEAGIGPKLIAGTESLTFLQPQRTRPQDTVSADDVEVADAYVNLTFGAELAQLFAKSNGTVFFHPPTEFRVPTFEQTSPFESSSAWIVSHLSPVAAENQRRFAHALAQRDQSMLVDGGWLLPMGQDDGLQEMMAAYRQLPTAEFEEFASTQTQPVVIRSLRTEDGICCYLVNDSPWQASVRLRFRSSSDLRSQTIGEYSTSVLTRRQGEESSTDVNLGPYDLQAFWFRASDLEIKTVEVELPQAPAQVARRLEVLHQGLSQLTSRQPDQISMTNGGFEKFYPSGAPVGWQSSPGSTLAQLRGANLANKGESAAIFRSNSGRASLLSDAFSPPTSGRLAVSAWLKIPHNAQAPLTRIAIVGEINGQTYYRYAPVRAGSTSAGLNNEWNQFVFHVQDLPSSGLANLRVQFELLEPGEVAVDDVVVYENLHPDSELVKIFAMLSRVEIMAEKGEWANCLRMLNGYWPQLLDEYATSSPSQLADGANEPKGVDDPKPRSGILDQVLPDWMKWR